MVKDLNVRPETIKLLEKIIGRRLFDINHSNIFLDLPPKTKEIKSKTNKQDPNKPKSFHITNKIFYQTNKTAE